MLGKSANKLSMAVGTSMLLTRMFKLYLEEFTGTVLDVKESIIFLFLQSTDKENL